MISTVVLTWPLGAGDHIPRGTMGGSAERACEERAPRKMGEETSETEEMNQDTGWPTTIHTTLVMNGCQRRGFL